ncbi:MAG: pilus assembly protein [Planctomycetota bacterium]|nr:MAG: pilus assembly protein [Planctomycetota bacterium]
MNREPEKSCKKSSIYPYANTRRGAAVVEMAVVTPLLLTIMFGIIEFGWVLTVKENINNATREACRVGILPGGTQQAIYDRFVEAVSPIGITVTPGMLTVIEATTANPVVTVRSSVPYSEVSLLGSFLGINPGTIGSSCVMRKEAMF